MKLDDFRAGVKDEIFFETQTNGKSDTESLFDYYTSILIDAEEIDDVNYVPFEAIGKRRAKVSIDGYSYDDLDNVLSIFTCSPLTFDATSVLTSTEAEKYFARARAFIVDADFLKENCEESSAGYGLICDVLGRFKKTVTKYKIYLLTDMLMSSKIKDIKSGEINGIPVEYNIWDVGRIYEIINSGKGKEDIVIDLKKYTELGIPCLPASKTIDYDAYLCNIPGTILANLYNEYGGRLLEGNVRSFLQTKGKVNKGIRNTILKEPSMFFAYNNGIAGTAYNIKTETTNGVLYITEITSLQIVNGGQTTASLAMAYLNDKRDNSEECISQIHVPMKLSVVSPEKSKELIPNISKYANSQNKVSDSDLWSNHPFHVRMEEFSRRTIAPTVAGKQYGTYWYYERANGQYRQETYKGTPSDRRSFELKYPSNQLFKKVDLAKYWNIKSLRPDIASAGGQKAFAKFAGYISGEWEKNETIFNVGFFKEIIAVAILFKQTDKIVKSQAWFNSYKANIVAYTISKIMDTVKSDYPERSIDLHLIWQKQDISQAWKSQIEETSKVIYDHLIDEKREVENVTEWAKREACWKQAQMIKLTLNKSFVDELGYIEDVKEKKQEYIKDQKENNKINCIVEVYEFGVENWKYLEQWNKERQLLNFQQLEFLRVATSMRNNKLPSDAQAKRILEVLEFARGEGFPK